MKKLFFLITFLFNVQFIFAQVLVSSEPKEGKNESVISPTDQKLYFTSGEYLQHAGTFYKAGLGFILFGSGYSYYCSTKDNYLSETIFGGIIAMGGVACLFIGSQKLVKAGIALDLERKITLHPSSSGIGIALKF